MRGRCRKLKVITKDIRAWSQLSSGTDVRSIGRANTPSPTCKTYSGPSRCCRTLLVSMDGTVIPLAVTVMGAPFGYLGGGGRTLIVVNRKSAFNLNGSNQCHALVATYNMAELGSLDLIEISVIYRWLAACWLYGRCTTHSLKTIQRNYTTV